MSCQLINLVAWCQLDGSGLELYWKLSDTIVDFKLKHTSSAAGWLSLAVNDNALMVGADAVIGQTSGTHGRRMYSRILNHT